MKWLLPFVKTERNCSSEPYGRGCLYFLHKFRRLLSGDHGRQSSSPKREGEGCMQKQECELSRQKNESYQPASPVQGHSRNALVMYWKQNYCPLSAALLISRRIRFYLSRLRDLVLSSSSIISEMRCDPLLIIQGICLLSRGSQQR